MTPATGTAAPMHCALCQEELHGNAQEHLREKHPGITRAFAADDYARPESVRESEVLREAAAAGKKVVAENGASPAEAYAFAGDIDGVEPSPDPCPGCRRHHAPEVDCDGTPLVAAGERKVLEENPRNVAVTICSGLEIKMLAAMGRDFEASGDAPALAWYRDADGAIRGVMLLGRVGV